MKKFNKIKNLDDRIRQKNTQIKQLEEPIKLNESLTDESECQLPE